LQSTKNCLQAIVFVILSMKYLDSWLLIVQQFYSWAQMKPGRQAFFQ
jgi:hypothetical protein